MKNGALSRNIKVNIVWLRRDLRIEDNSAIQTAAESSEPTLLLFIFDKQILKKLECDDRRVAFIHGSLKHINEELGAKESSVLIKQGNVAEVWGEILDEYAVQNVFFNRDYEPYPIERDKNVKELLESKGIAVQTTKDHVIFEPGEILKDNGEPYTVYTPFKKKWLEKFHLKKAEQDEFGQPNWVKATFPFPDLDEIGFEQVDSLVSDYNISALSSYAVERDIPVKDVTSKLSPHLRFGTVSIRQIVKAVKQHETFLSELIWREFFIHVLCHFPYSVNQNFRSIYDGIKWRNNEEEFKRWCEGKTGYPMVDAGMRQLNETGFMHNRVRMVVASFLCKHLLIDWRKGEAYFAAKLLDFELASNVGNWQWCAGTGCDAAPYFRVFNPTTQQEKFDPDFAYIKRWVPEFGSDEYPEPMVDHKIARKRALEAYGAARSA